MSRHAVSAPLVALTTAVVLNLGTAIAVHDDPSLTDDQREALESARTRLAAMLTFSHEDLEGDLSVASANATGAFREEYRGRLRRLVESAWRTRKASIRSTVTHVACVASDASSVTVLASLSSRVSGERSRPRRQVFDVRATFVGADGQWLVSSLTLL